MTPCCGVLVMAKFMGASYRRQPSLMTRLMKLRDWQPFTNAEIIRMMSARINHLISILKSR